jgi:hypothetical protein
LNRFILQKFPIVGFLLLAALGSIPSGARAANFTASLDRDSIALGEQVSLTLRFDGDAPDIPPRLADVPGLNIGYVGNQSMNLNINGVASSIVTFTYAVTPTRAGEYSIPIDATDSAGNKISTTPLKLTVTQPQTPPEADINSGSQIAFARLTLPKKKIYAGEILVADLQVFYRQDTQLAQQPQLLGLENEGFTIGKIISSDLSQTQIGGTTYNVIPAKIPLTVKKSGSLSIGPVTVGLLLDVPSESRPTTTFGGFIFNFGGDRKKYSLPTETITNEALPLPPENVPLNFSGAVGDFTLAASVGPTNVTVGDPVTVRVQISGRGALDAIQLPDQSALNNFKLFPPTAKTETSDQLGLEGTKTFEEIVTPQNSDVHEWPQFSFSFFNPDDGQYHTLTQPAVSLVVKAAGSTPMPTIAANNNSAPQNQTSQDILPIKENLGTLITKTVPLITQPQFLALQSLPVLAFLAAFVWRKRTDNLANNPRLRRKIAVQKLVQNGIAGLRKFAGENNSEEFFALLFRLLQEQLGERLDCPAGAITENVVEENSILCGATEAARNDLRELFLICNQARYAPVRGTSELNHVAAQFEKVIGELQEVKA